MMPEAQAAVGRKDLKWNVPPPPTELIAAEAQDPTFQQYADSNSYQELNFNMDSYGFLLWQSTTDGAIQTVEP